MKTRPILFSAPMVRALLAGTKTQTRRVCKPSKTLAIMDDGSLAQRDDDVCPYGVPGDRLWVRETFAACRHMEKHPGCVGYRADGDPEGLKWRPSIFMPRALSRITLEVTDVRVQRLQDISEEDARAEGVDPKTWGADAMAGQGARAAYAELWDEINGAGAWEKNPWVWAISFKRVQS